MQPVTYQEGSMNDNENDAGEASTQSSKLRWTYNKDLCAVLHKTGCKVCQEWKDHYNNNILNFRSAQRYFYFACNKALELKWVCLEQKWEAALEEAKALCHEIWEIQAEIQRVQQGQQTLEEVTGKIHQTINQLQDDIRDLHCIPPFEPSPPWHYKHQHWTHTAFQCLSTAEVIWVSNDSNRDHAPTTAPITDVSTIPIPVPSDGWWGWRVCKVNYQSLPPPVSHSLLICLSCLLPCG